MVIEYFRSDNVEFAIEISPVWYGVFEIGLSNHIYNRKDGSVDREFKISLLIINIYFVFNRNEA
jgi:hypothetical protein